MTVISITRTADPVVCAGGPIRGAMFALPASIALWIMLVKAIF